MPDKPMLIRHVPEDLKRDFKALCAKKGCTMNWTVLEFIRRYTDGLIEFDKAIKEAKEKADEALRRGE